MIVTPVWWSQKQTHRQALRSSTRTKKEAQRGRTHDGAALVGEVAYIGHQDAGVGPGAAVGRRHRQAQHRPEGQRQAPGDRAGSP